MPGAHVASKYFPERSYVRGQNQHERLQFDWDSICTRSNRGILFFSISVCRVGIRNLPEQFPVESLIGVDAALQAENLLCASPGCLSHPRRCLGMLKEKRDGLG